jgi:hypothetical protein
MITVSDPPADKYMNDASPEEERAAIKKDDLLTNLFLHREVYRLGLESLLTSRSQTLTPTYFIGVFMVNF